MLNYLGLTCVLLGGISISLVRRTVALPQLPNKFPKISEDSVKIPSKKLLTRMERCRSSTHLEQLNQLEGELMQQIHRKMLSTPRKVMYVAVYCHKFLSTNYGFRHSILSLLAGFFFGATVIPVLYMEEHPELYPKAPRVGLPYIYSRRLLCW